MHGSKNVKYFNFSLLFFCQISISNFGVDRMLQATDQTLFYIRHRKFSFKFLISFSHLYPNIRSYIFLWNGKHIKKFAPTRFPLIWEEMWVRIRQGACCSVYFYSYMQFTQHVATWIYFVHTVLFISLCIL